MNRQQTKIFFRIKKHFQKKFLKQNYRFYLSLKYNHKWIACLCKVSFLLFFVTFENIFLQQHFILLTFQIFFIMRWRCTRIVWKCRIYRVSQYIFSSHFQYCWLTTLSVIFCCCYGAMGFNFGTAWLGIIDIIHHVEWAFHHRHDIIHGRFLPPLPPESCLSPQYHFKKNLFPQIQCWLPINCGRAFVWEMTYPMQSWGVIIFFL